MEIKYEPCVSSKPVYVSIDGTHHYDRASAVRHDAMALSGTRYIEQNGIDLPNDEGYMMLYNITCQEDWKYLWYTAWEQNTYGTEYVGPGWYGALWHDGGDYADEYEIIKISSYVNKQEIFLTELKHLTSTENMV